MFEENDALRLLWEDKQKGFTKEKYSVCQEKNGPPEQFCIAKIYGKNLLTGHTVPRILRAHKKHVPVSPSDPE